MNTSASVIKYRIKSLFTILFEISSIFLICFEELNRSIYGEYKGDNSLLTVNVSGNDFTVIFTGEEIFHSVIRSLAATILLSSESGHSSFVFDGTILDTLEAIMIS